MLQKNCAPLYQNVRQSSTLSPIAIRLNNLHIFSRTMKYKTLCAIVSFIAAMNFVTFVTSSSPILQTASAAKTNQCGISETVHEEQQALGKQGGGFGTAVGEFNKQFGSTPEAQEFQKTLATSCSNNP